MSERLVQEAPMAFGAEGRIPTDEEVLIYARLKKYRSIMNHTHEGGNIYYDAGRMAAYCIIAKLASEERQLLGR